MTSPNSNEEDWSPWPREWIDVAPYTSELAFSAITYNILNDSFVINNPEYAVYLKDENECLKSSAFRNRRILSELSSWCPDLVALQEVRSDLFCSQLMPQMASRGFVGLMSTARSICRSGVALFFRHEAFELQRALCAPFDELMTACFSAKELEMLRHPKAAEYSALLARLLHKPSGRSFVIASFHATWEEFKAPVFKSLQVAALVRHAEQMAQDTVGSPCPVLLLGDLNSAPGQMPYELLAKNEWSTDVLLEAEVQRQSNVLTKFVESSCRLPQNLQFCSCYKEATGNEPVMTSLTNEYGVFTSFCLDYIWLSKDRGLKLTGVMKECDEADLREFDALPSPKFPSDHVPIMARLQFDA